LTQNKDTACAPADLVRLSTCWETIIGSAASSAHREPWNKDKIVGQKAPFKLRDHRAFRVRLEMENRVRELALFNLGIESKLRGAEVVQAGGVEVR
jgi:hypothetical protein